MCGRQVASCSARGQRNVCESTSRRYSDGCMLRSEGAPGEAAARHKVRMSTVTKGMVECRQQRGKGGRNTRLGELLGGAGDELFARQRRRR